MCAPHLLPAATGPRGRVLDGLDDADPSRPTSPNFIARQAVPTDVTIDMEVFGPGAMWDVRATVCIEPGGTGKTMKVFMAQVLDHYGPTNFTRNMVQDGSSGSRSRWRRASACSSPRAFVLNSLSQASPGNVKFFAWAQDPVLVYMSSKLDLSAGTTERIPGPRCIRPTRRWRRSKASLSTASKTGDTSGGPNSHPDG